MSTDTEPKAERTLITTLISDWGFVKSANAKKTEPLTSLCSHDANSSMTFYTPNNLINFALIYKVILYQLTTSGASMSCRKEWRLKVDRGFLMRVKGQRSEVIGVMNPL